MLINSISSSSISIIISISISSETTMMFCTLINRHGNGCGYGLGHELRMNVQAGAISSNTEMTYRITNTIYMCVY